MITPYVNAVGLRRVAILTRAGNVRGERDPDVIFVTADRCRELLTRGFGKAVCWNGDPIRLVIPDGRQVIVLRVDEAATDADLISGIVAWRDAMYRFGARVSSVGSSAWSLLRASIAEPFHDAAGQAPPLQGVIGGRQIQPRSPGRYRDVIQHDLVSAYPRTLATAAYGGAWSWEPHARWVDVAKVASAGVPCFVSAIVRLPDDLDFGPLPRRPRGRRDAWQQIILPTVYPSRGEIRGFWTAREIVAAAEVGADVKLRGAWFHGAFDRPFARWWDRVLELRSLPGFAAVLGKATGNAMWGQLAISVGERTTLTFEGGERRVADAPLGGAGRPRMYDLAEHVTGTVRARLYLELIAPDAERIVIAHTDGGWLDAGASSPAAEDWRIKSRASILDVCNPQTYRYRDTAGRWSYRVAGTPATDAPRAFREAWAGVRLAS